MTALSAGVRRLRQLQTDTLLLPVAGGATLYMGGLVCTGHDGYARPAADEPYYIFEGMALWPCDVHGNRLELTDNFIDNSAGDDGDYYVLVARRGRVRIASADGVTQSAMSCIAYVSDDNTVALLAASVDHDIRCGRVDRIISASEVEISLDCRTHCTSREYDSGGLVTTTTEAATTTTAAAATTTTVEAATTTTAAA